jgi:hypothetical protein
MASESLFFPVGYITCCVLLTGVGPRPMLVRRRNVGSGVATANMMCS